MAGLAPAVVRRSGKLAAVDVLVAVATPLEFDFVESRCSGGNMALGAGNTRMLGYERIGRRGVFGQAEFGRFEPLQSMARPAIAPVFAGQKLSAMRVGLVTIRALAESNRLIECCSRVARGAAHGRMLSEQRILRPGMIEPGVQRLRGNLLPGQGRMAGFTVRLEGSAVRVVVAGRTFVKSKADILHDFAASGWLLMTLHTANLLVRAGKGVLGLGVVKSRSSLPVVERVAGEAVPSQLAAVLVLVAGEAIARESQKSPVQVRDFDDGSFSIRDVCGVVAHLTGDGGVPALQDVTCFAMVKSLLRRLPADEQEFLSIVLGVAARAVFREDLAVDNRSVIAAANQESPRNLSVALQAFERGHPGCDPVAARALGWPTQGLVRSRKCAGRDLAECRATQQQTEHQHCKRTTPRQG